jgi:hypothetical protein
MGKVTECFLRIRRHNSDHFYQDSSWDRSTDAHTNRKQLKSGGNSEIQKLTGRFYFKIKIIWTMFQHVRLEIVFH